MDQGSAPPPPVDEALRHELLTGLAASQKRLPSKLFYDAHGSSLFDAICELPEYYVTRTEVGIMQAHGADIAAVIGSGTRLIEFGSGSSIKTRVLLDHLDAPSAYVPIDISTEHLLAAAQSLRTAYPHLAIEPLAADFTEALQLHDANNAPHVNTAVYFPGSTLGNFEPDAAVALLRRIRTLAGSRGGLLLGADLRKPLPILQAAYDDAAGVTAAFNLNLLTRLNREFGADFDIESFVHRARWNEPLSRIEMHLRAERALSFSIFGETFHMQAGETLHTENSHKYALDALSRMAEGSGFGVAQTWTDPLGWFAVQWWQSDANASLALAA